jgi:TRAP transporter TAXI family solute receptor
MRVSRSWSVRFLLLLLPAVGAACGAPTGTTTTRLSIATGGTGGVFYPYGGGIARVISEHLPNVEATAEVTAASVDNLKFIQRGTSDLAFTMADTAQDALLGRDSFASSGKVAVRTLATLYSSYVHLVTLTDSGIARIEDLRGRIVSTGAAGSGTTILANRILQTAGLDPARDIRSQSLGVAQSVDALKDGKIDAFFWNGGLPTAAILDLINTPGVRARVLSTVAVLPQLQKTFGESLYFAAPIPKDTYDQDADVPVVGVANLLVVSDMMSEPLAYDITRLLFEQQATLASIHPEARQLSLSAAVASSPVPYHPGAVRYYRERGVWKE